MYTRKLRHVSISYSHLQHVGHDLLTGLDDLKFAMFRGHPCIDMDAATKEEIEELNRQLPISCNTLVTTTEPPALRHVKY